MGVMNIHTKKYTASNQVRAIDVTLGKAGAKKSPKVVMSLKSKKALASKPSKSWSQFYLSRRQAKGVETIHKLIGEGNYRADLISQTVDRYTRLLEGNKRAMA